MEIPAIGAASSAGCRERFTLCKNSDQETILHYVNMWCFASWTLLHCPCQRCAGENKKPGARPGGEVVMLKRSRIEERVPGFGCTYLRFTETWTLFGLPVWRVRGWERIY